MILNTKDFKSACSKILYAMDNNGIENLVGKVELKTENNQLFLNVTNGAYFVEVKLCDCSEEFHATVNADMFLKLSSKLTKDTVEFSVTENALIINSNGSYQIPLIFDNNVLLELPKININNKTVNFNIDGNILNSILTNNGKELIKNKKKEVNPLQSFCYLDNNGAITFHYGACVTKFTLDKPVKVLVQDNVVRLFSLFKDTAVEFTLGYDTIAGDITQTKLQLKNDSVCITIILSSDDVDVNKFPAELIRSKAYYDYSNIVTIDKNVLLSAIQRIKIFANDPFQVYNKDIGVFTFTKSGIKITDYYSHSEEEVPYVKSLPYDITFTENYELDDFKLALESSKDQYITLGFEEDCPIVIAKDNIYIVIAIRYPD